MRKMLFFILLGTFFYSQSFATSCSLDGPPLKERVKNADVIFIGIVESDNVVTPAGDYDHEAMVRIKKVFKGDVPEKVIVQYLEGDCDGSRLWSLSVGMGKDILFYAKSRNDKFFASSGMGVRFAIDQDVRRDISILPGVIKEASRPWWDFFGWTK